MELMQHQSEFLERARTHRRFGAFWEPGCGKTIAVLAAIVEAKSNSFVGKTLVLCPKSIMQSAWLGDAAYFPDLSCVVCWSEKPHERCALIDTPGADALITNYEQFKKHKDDFIKAGVTRLVIDESSKVKSHDSQISRACHAFADQMESVFILSGTPAPNSATEYWSQIRCLDKSIFGDSFWRFAFRYFIPIRRNINGVLRIAGWKMIGDGVQGVAAAWQDPNAGEHPLKTEFMDKLRSCTWSLSKTECLDLPEQTDVIRQVELSDDERDAYNDMLNQLRLELKDGRVLTSGANAKSMKLRQITGGSVLAERYVQDIGTSKLDELAELFEELGPRQSVTWAEFTHEINAIANLCGDTARIIDGRTPLALRTKAIQDFQAGTLQRLVCHPAAAGHGITLTGASHAIYFSHGYSFETYGQSRDRIHRKGQRNPCTYWHLIATKTIDEKILDCLRDKHDAHEAIFEELGCDVVV